MRKLASYRNISYQPVANPELYVQMLRETYTRAPTGQLYTSKRDRAAHRNACRLAVLIRNDLEWDCFTVYMIQPTPQTPAFWKRLVATQAVPYASEVALPELNQQRADDAAPWSLHGFIGWRTDDCRLFVPRGSYVVLPSGAPVPLHGSS